MGQETTVEAESRYYHPVPWDKVYGMSDWLERQHITVENWHYHRLHGINGPETVEVVFKVGATAKQKARIGRTFAWDKLRRLKGKKLKDLLAAAKIDKA